MLQLCYYNPALPSNPVSKPTGCLWPSLVQAVQSWEAMEEYQSIQETVSELPQLQAPSNAM
jgi:hypothetical protein